MENGEGGGFSILACRIHTYFNPFSPFRLSLSLSSFCSPFQSFFSFFKTIFPPFRCRLPLRVTIATSNPCPTQEQEDELGE